MNEEKKDRQRKRKAFRGWLRRMKKRKSWGVCGSCGKVADGGFVSKMVGGKEQVQGYCKEHIEAAEDRVGGDGEGAEYLAVCPACGCSHGVG